jgi:hypothetical protein
MKPTHRGEEQTLRIVVAAPQPPQLGYLEFDLQTIFLQPSRLFPSGYR